MFESKAFELAFIAKLSPQARRIVAYIGASAALALFEKIGGVTLLLRDMGVRIASRAIEQREEAVPAFTTVIMGVITAVFGGVLRDIICAEVPMILRDTKPYSTCTFTGCWVYIGIDLLEMAPDWSLIGATLTVVSTRLISLRRGWQLPR